MGLKGVIFKAPNHVAGIQISTHRKVPNNEIIKVSKEGMSKSGNKLKSTPKKRAAEDITFPILPIRSQSVSSMIVTLTLHKTITNKKA